MQFVMARSPLLPKVITLSAVADVRVPSVVTS